MSDIKTYCGKEAVEVYKNEIKQNATKEDLQNIDYIEMFRIPNHDLNAYFVYIKEIKEGA